MIEDVLRYPPCLLFAAAAPSGSLSRPDFDFIRYFSQDRRFANSMRDYELVERIDGFQVYRRKRLTAATESVR